MAIDLAKVRKGKPKSIITLADKFPNIIVEDAYEDLNKDWRELILVEIPALRET